MVETPRGCPSMTARFPLGHEVPLIDDSLKTCAVKSAAMAGTPMQIFERW